VKKMIPEKNNFAICMHIMILRDSDNRVVWYIL